MDDLFRQSVNSELEAMCEELDKCLEQGAIGLSTGLAYGTAREQLRKLSLWQKSLSSMTAFM